MRSCLPVSVVEKILLIGVVVLVLIVELLNTGIEAAVDRDSFEIDPLWQARQGLWQRRGHAVACCLPAARGLAILARTFL